jgi:Rod binding domain-containing protein
MDIQNSVGAAVDASKLSQVENLEKSSKTIKDIAKVKKLATDFEAMFMEQMLKGMRSSVQKSGLIDGGNAEEIYTSMLDSEYAKSMASQRGTGLSDMVERQLLESMGIKSDISAKIGMNGAIHAYEKISQLPLREGPKPVTMESSSHPQIVKAR